MIEVLFVDASEKQARETEAAKKLQILEDEINAKLAYLQKGISNAIGERFSVEIIGVQYVSPSVAMITTNTKKA